MAYPNSIDSFSTKIDNTDDVMADHINQLQNSMTAIQNELGTLPKGSYANIKTRLDNLAVKDSTLQTNLNADLLDNKNSSSYLPIKGTFSDTTTTIVASGTYTLNIPLGENDRNSGTMIVDGVGGGTYIIFTDIISEAKSINVGSISAITGTTANASVLRGTDTNLTSYAFSASNSYIAIQSVRINGSNLEIVFINGNSSSSQTLSAYGTWFVN